MQRAFVALSRGVFNLLYQVFSFAPRRDEVLFLSRQTNEPSYDFKALGEVFITKGFKPIYLVKKLSKKTIFSYMGHVVKEIYHLARCRICFVDRYDPVVSLLDFTYEKVEPDSEALHYEFPSEPVIIQLWHAFGAYKCFGYQSLDTIEGHTSITAQQFRIHRNYSYIICSGEGCRQSFSEAFGYPKNRVVAMMRPEFDLLSRDKQKVSAVKKEKKTVLFAPTLRKDSSSPHPFRELLERGAWMKLGSCAEVIWSFHPLEETGFAPGDVNESLSQADYVVTDYSSIVYEAFLLGKKVLFYVPDIETFTISPGLNTNPEIESPSITYRNFKDLIDIIYEYCGGIKEYPREELERFVQGAFVGVDGSTTEAIADFALRMYRVDTRRGRMWET